jgi:hypothetical protein
MRLKQGMVCFICFVVGNSNTASASVTCPTSVQRRCISLNRAVISDSKDKKPKN